MCVTATKINGTDNITERQVNGTDNVCNRATKRQWNRQRVLQSDKKSTEQTMCATEQLLFCSLKKGHTPKIGMLCFVIINSILWNLLCV